MTVFAALLAMICSAETFSQTPPLWIYQRSFYFDSNGLTGGTQESRAQIGDSATYQWTYGMKNLVYHEGMFYHVFAQREGDWDVYLRRSADGITWTPKVQVNDDSLNANQYYAGVTVTGTGTNTRVIVQWTDFRGPNPQLRCAVSADGGNSFSPSVAISNHTDSDFLDGNIAADAAGNLYASWFRRTPGNAYFYTYFSRSTDGGTTWTPQQIIFTGRIYSYPNHIVASGDGTVMVVICDDQNNRNNLVVRYSANHGTTWSTHTQITNYPFGQGAQPWFSLNIGNDNTIYAIYEYGRTGPDSNRIRISRSTDWGITWSPTVRVSDPIVIFPIHESHASGNPSVAIATNGNVYAVWADQRYDLVNKVWNVYLSRSTDGGETWSADMLVNGLPETQDQLHASVAVKSNGVIDTVLVTWNDRRTDPTDVGEETRLPAGYSLSQNYPNPFNPSTTFTFYIQHFTFVILKVYNVFGQEVATLVNEVKAPGSYEVTWDAKGFASGVYLYRLQVGEFVATRKLMLLR
jgi:hypothetical protein